MTTLDDLINRGVDKVYPSKEELEGKAKKEKLRVYQGFDPTSPELHIGHMIGLRKLRQWQDLGHEVIFLIGDFTATIGDPTGKDTTRVPMTQEEVLKNAKTYKEQAGRILRFDGDNPVKIKFNSEWLGKISAQELLKLAGNITHGQLIERDMFQNRFKKEKDIYLSELLYPLMQAYDSVVMDVDVEVGGTDQTFNMLMGRKLMRNLKQREKFVMTTPLFADSQGQKIGKTEGNAISIDEEPSNLYAKIMALGDDVIVKGFEYLTDISTDEVDQITKDLKGGKNPISYKKMLSFEIVKQLSSHEEAHKAQQDFEKTVQNREQPLDIKTVKYPDNALDFYDLLVKVGTATSRSMAKRLIEQGGVNVNGKNLKDLPFYKITNGSILKVGKKKPIKIEY